MAKKVVKIPLISIIEKLDYPAVCKELWKIQNDIRNIKNKTIQLCWEWQNFKHDYSREKGILPNVSDVLRTKRLDGDIYSFLRIKYPSIYSANLSTSIKNAYMDFNNAFIKIKNGERSIIEYKRNPPIELHAQSILLDYADDSYVISLKLFSDSYGKELGLANTMLKFKAFHLENSQKSILSRCISGEYRIAESKLLYMQRKKQWFLNLCYDFKPEQNKNADINKIMGVDLGIACVAYMSFNFCEDRYMIDGGEVINFRHSIERRRRELLRQGKYCADGRIGHGVKTRIAPTDKIGNSISNFRNTANHKYSRFIVDTAAKHGCGVIQMELIKDLPPDDIFLKNWDYFDLRTKIAYKAKEKGISVVFVNPAYTSQRCSKCGCIDERNRPKKSKGQAYFKCISCGFEANADYNASQNLATENIENIISSYKTAKCEP